MISLLLAFASPAVAATNEISFEAGWITSWDPSYRVFSDSGTHGSYGLRLGYAVHDNVAIIAGWQHAANGGDVGMPALGSSGGYDDDYYESDTAFRAALYTDQITVGGKADVKVWKWLHPYATLQVVGMRGLVRLDDDSSDDENLGQVQVAGLTGGALGALGLDFPIHIRGNVSIAPYVEMGYGWLAPMQFQELGSVQFSGFAGRGGVGVRF